MSLLLDMVTVSELWKGNRTDLAVRRWHDALTGSPAYLSVVTMNEILYGILKLKGRDEDFAKLLSRWYESLVTEPEIFPLLDVNLRTAERAADFRASFGMSYNNSFIAATASVHGLSLATRNVSDSERTGINLINPWETGT